MPALAHGLSSLNAGRRSKRAPAPVPLMTPKGDLVTAPEPLYASHPECLIVLFDRRHPNGPAELRRHRAALAEHAAIEALSEDVFALIIRPGWASKAVA